MRRRKPARPAAEPDLGPAMAKVVEEYMGFLAEADADPKAFTARHAAAKAALSHIEQLMKLSGHDPDAAATKLGEYHKLLDEARHGLRAEQEETPSDGDGDPG